jgi:hypothetical protein
MTSIHTFGLLAVVILFADGCTTAETSSPAALASASASSESAPSASASSVSQPLAVSSPVQNARVSGQVIEVTGVGADPKGQLEVSVLTDAWYVQNGTATINADGSFSYAPVHISGQGKFNNHTIKVTVIKDGKRVTSTSVAGVVRLD